MKNEPLVTLASITAGVTALLALLVAFGIPITQAPIGCVMQASLVENNG